MSLLFRSVRRARWLNRPSWVPDKDVQARVLRDFFRDTDGTTAGDELSFWRVKDDCSDLDDAILAVASCRNEPSNVDYALLPEDCLSSLGLKTSAGEGLSPFQEANPKHLNLVTLTVSAVSRLVSAIWEENRFKRKREKHVKALLVTAFSEGKLDVHMLKDSMREKLKAGE